IRSSLGSFNSRTSPAASQEPIMTRYTEFHQASIQDPTAFWAREADHIDWHDRPEVICDYSRPPFAKWFVGGTTNLCHNALDRHLPQRATQAALICVST